MPPTASGDQTPAADPPGDLHRLLHAQVSRRTVVQALALAPLAVAVLKAPPARSVARVEILPVGTAPRSIPFPASHLGVRWLGSEAATVEARLSTGTGWSAWRRLAVDHDLSDPGRLVLSGLIRAAGALQVQLRAAGDAHRLEVVAIDASSAAGPASDRRRGTETAPPEVVTRAQWGADESMRKPPPEFAPIVKLAVHHTVPENDDPDPAATVRAIYAYHLKGRGRH